MDLCGYIDVSDIATRFEERIDGYHGSTVNVLSDIQSKMELRPTMEYFESTMQNSIEKFKEELNAKIDKKLSQIKLIHKRESSVISF